MSLTLLGVSGPSFQSVNSFILDAYPGAAVGYSVRKLSSLYSGPCVRVRRDSDDTEIDVGFNVLGGLNTGLISSFCSGTDGFITTWYDQTGNNKHLIQVAAASQPRIYSSTLGIEYDNGAPTLVHGVGTELYAINVAVNGLTTMSVNVTGRGKTSGNQSSAKGIVYWVETGSWGSLYEAHNTDFLLGRFGTGQANNNIGGTLPSSTSPRIVNMIKEGTNEFFYYNNILRTAPTGRLATIANTDSTLRTNYNNFDCNIQEILVYYSSVRPTLNAFNTNINNYFNAY